jgi:dATP pyrophosphohydrolase
VLVVICAPNLDVLLIERSKQPGFWQSLTGSKDFEDEAWADTALREGAEEAGIAVGSPEVPASALVDWALENIFEICPVWRHRYGTAGDAQHRVRVRAVRAA